MLLSRPRLVAKSEDLSSPVTVKPGKPLTSQEGPFSAPRQAPTKCSFRTERCLSVGRGSWQRCQQQHKRRGGACPRPGVATTPTTTQSAGGCPRPMACPRPANHPPPNKQGGHKGRPYVIVSVLGPSTVIDGHAFCPCSKRGASWGRYGGRWENRLANVSPLRSLDRLGTQGCTRVATLVPQ